MMMRANLFNKLYYVGIIATIWRGKLLLEKYLFLIEYIKCMF
jgi:hypothetical protein